MAELPWITYQRQQQQEAPPPAAPAEPPPAVAATPAPTTEEAPWEEFSTDQDKAYSAEWGQAFNSGATQDQLDAIAAKYGAPPGGTKLAEDIAKRDAGTKFDVGTVKTGRRQPVSKDAATVAGLKSGALLGGDDEISGIGAAVGNWLGRETPINSLLGLFGYKLDEGTGQGFWADYERERAGRDAFKDQAWEEQPLAYGIGYVPGAITSAVLPGGRAAQGGSMGRNALRLGGVGATYGGVGGALGSDPGERIGGAVVGAPLGFALGAASQPVSRFLIEPAVNLGTSAFNRIAGRASTPPASAPANALNTDWEALFRAAPQRADEMAGRAAEFRAAGVEPRPIDVIDEAGRGAVRAAVPRSGAAREQLARQSDAVYVDAQDRVAQRAAEAFGPGPTSRTIAREAREERGALAGTTMEPLRSRPIEITPEIVEVLQTPEGQRALIAARATMLPDERDQVNAVMTAVRQGDFGDPIPAEARALIEQLPPGLSPAARQAAEQQIISSFPAREMPTLTLDIADKLSRSLLGRANANVTPGLARVVGNMGRGIRDAARTQVPEYGTFLDEYAARSRVADAAEGTGAFAEGDFLRTPADEYARTVSEATPTPVEVSGVPTTELDAMRARARTQVQDAATSGTAGAVRTARQLATGSAQQQRAAAVLGTEGAERLQRGAQSELDRVRNTRYIDERVGSKTAGMSDDAQALDSLINELPSIATGGKWGVVRAVSRILKRGGIRGANAERVVRGVLNEGRTDEMINYLTRRGMQQDRARAVVRNILATGGGRAAGAAVSSAPAPNNTLNAPMEEF